MVQKIDASPYQ